MREEEESEGEIKAKGSGGTQVRYNRRQLDVNPAAQRCGRDSTVRLKEPDRSLVGLRSPDQDPRVKPAGE
jgi:hypothetical protein